MNFKKATLLINHNESSISLPKKKIRNHPKYNQENN